MPVLDNKKHEAFAQAIADGMSYCDAYKQFVSRGNCSDATAYSTGCRLSKDSKIAARVQELQKKIAQKVEKKFDLTKEKWLEQLKRIADKAEETEDYKASTSALTQIGKAADYYAPTKVEHSGAIGVEVLLQAVQEVFAPK